MESNQLYGWQPRNISIPVRWYKNTNINFYNPKILLNFCLLEIIFFGNVFHWKLFYIFAPDKQHN